MFRKKSSESFNGCGCSLSLSLTYTHSPIVPNLFLLLFWGEVYFFFIRISANGLMTEEKLKCLRAENSHLAIKV